MRGVEDARKLITAELAAKTPTKILELRFRLDLPNPASDGLPQPGTLTAPGTIVANERPTIDAWPALLTVPLSVVRYQRVDERDGYPVFAGRYRLRTYIYARGQGFDDVRDQVDRLTLAVTEILLFITELDHAGAQVDPTSIAGQFSGIDPLDDVDQAASAYLEYDVTIEENLAPTPPPLGPPSDTSADTIIVDVIPPHPALD